MLVVHCTLRASQSNPFLNSSSLRKVVLSHLPRSHHTRSVEAKQLDEGIGDTFVSVAVKNGAHTSVSISASDSARIPRAAHLEAAPRRAYELGQLQAAARRASVSWI